MGIADKNYSTKKMFFNKFPFFYKTKGMDAIRSQEVNKFINIGGERKMSLLKKETKRVSDVTERLAQGCTVTLILTAENIY